MVVDSQGEPLLLDHHLLNDDYQLEELKLGWFSVLAFLRASSGLAMVVALSFFEGPPGLKIACELCHM
jgi:hypothetical protein